MASALATLAALTTALLATEIALAVVLLVLAVAASFRLAGAGRRAVLLVLAAAYVRPEEPPADCARWRAGHLDALVRALVETEVPAPSPQIWLQSVDGAC